MTRIVSRISGSNVLDVEESVLEVHKVARSKTISVNELFFHTDSTVVIIMVRKFKSSDVQTTVSSSELPDAPVLISSAGLASRTFHKQT